MIEIDVVFGHLDAPLRVGDLVRARGFTEVVWRIQKLLVDVPGAASPLEAHLSVEHGKPDQWVVALLSQEGFVRVSPVALSKLSPLEVLALAGQ